MDERGELEDLRELGERLAETSARIGETMAAWASLRFTGTAADGGVVATVDTTGNLLALDISVVSKRRLDGVTLGDAVVKAIRAAERAAAESEATMTRELEQITGPRVGKLLSDSQRSFEERSGLWIDPDE
ncbi:YbaB/EbfC family nucleoid-associated protein [Streptosporangium sp. CA-135522]|uniref:YbaB/EbfC family nucleoid-associated protein n=1 Tax=Streptosporangium sp. CA-135522 TaxID=3240072 RepID=UPI003D8FCF89